MPCTLSRALECAAGAWEAQRSVVHQSPKRLPQVRCWNLTHTHTHAVRTVLLAGPNCNCHCRRLAAGIYCATALWVCARGVWVTPWGSRVRRTVVQWVCRQPRLNGGINGPLGWGAHALDPRLWVAQRLRIRCAWLNGSSPASHVPHSGFVAPNHVNQHASI